MNTKDLNSVVDSALLLREAEEWEKHAIRITPTHEETVRRARELLNRQRAALEAAILDAAGVREMLTFVDGMYLDDQDALRTCSREVLVQNATRARALLDKFDAKEAE